MKNFFDSLTDNDFFSNKLTHIYFNSFVDDKSIDNLINDIRNANKLDEPKPILIHICSKGGRLIDGLRLLSVFKISKVPIATIIDNYSWSASTYLSIASPYRVIVKNGFCLLHDFSIFGVFGNKHQYITDYINKIESYFNSVVNMYIKKTKMNKNELNELLQHDLYIDSSNCLKKGIVDRIINPHYSYPIPDNININTILKDNNTSNINLSLCPDFIQEFDNIIINNKNNNPFIFYPIHNECIKNNENKDKEKEQEKEKTPQNIDITSYDILNSLNFISRINSINNPKYSVIDTPISIDNLLPLLFTDKIYMYSHSFIICNLLYLQQFKSILIEDTIQNNKIIFNKIKNILKSKTNMTINDINNINKKFRIINAKEAKELNLCHEIIS